MSLPLSSLKLFLHDLFDKRRKDLVRSHAGKFFESKLQAKRAAIDALPPALTGGAPLAKELEAMDGRHDGYGAAIWFATEAVLRLPDAEASLLADAKAIRAAFIPGLDELKSTYAEEADRAKERRPHLAAMKKALDRFDVGGVKLSKIASEYLTSGEALSALLSERADQTPSESRKAAPTLRGSTIGLIHRFRRELAEEVAEDHDLPRDLEHRVFGYLDTLEGMSSTPAGHASPDPAPPPAASGGTPAAS